jgi:hypothetical protein
MKNLKLKTKNINMLLAKVKPLEIEECAQLGNLVLEKPWEGLKLSPQARCGLPPN